MKFVNLQFLDEWSPSLAWWLGLVYGDGNVYQTDKSNRVTFVCNTDTAMKWRDLICPDAGIQTKKNCLSIYVDSKALVDWFVDRGIVGEKATNLEWPSFLPVGMYSHFMRGLFDTDGSVNIEKRKEKCGNDMLRVMFSGKNLSFVERVEHEVSTIAQIEPCKVINNKKFLNGKDHFWSSIKHSGIPATKICDALYVDSNDKIRGEQRYSTYKTYVDNLPSLFCSCGGDSWTDGLCRPCWWARRRETTVKQVCECGRYVVAKGLCLPCYKRVGRLNGKKY